MQTTRQPATRDFSCSFVGRRYDFCWDFIRDYYAGRGIDIARDAYKNRDGFAETDQPKTGDLVILSQYHMAAHCGIYQDGHIYHHTDKLGVVRQRADSFLYRRYYMPIS